MQSSPEQEKLGLLATLKKNYSGPITHVALSAMSAWMIVIGLKGLAGFAVTRQTAVADLLGICIVIGLARWFTSRSHPK